MGIFYFRFFCCRSFVVALIFVLSASALLSADIPAENSDVPALAAAMVRLCRDEPLRQRLGMNGERRLDREFRWDDKLSLVAQVYQELTVKPIPSQ